MPDKIDTHHHFLPAFYLDALGSNSWAAMMPDRVSPRWSVEAALDHMDRAGIAESVLSLSVGPKLDDPVTVLRKCNDYGADLRARHPKRFGLFACLPCRIPILTNYDGHYLGNSTFDPIWEELNRRKTAVLIHPTLPQYVLALPQYALADQPPAGVLELPFETTRTATSLVLSGALTTYPDIAFILSHAGGAWPFLSQRIQGAVMMVPGAAERVGNIEDSMRRFWYDTALSMSKSAMAALLAVADPARITFGTDFPYAPPVITQMSSQSLATWPMEEALRAAIGWGNAARLLGRSRAESLAKFPNYPSPAAHGLVASK